MREPSASEVGEVVGEPVEVRGMVGGLTARVDIAEGSRRV